MVKLRILVGSWNVNAKPPDGQDLSKWLCQSETPPDIVAVSLQEIVELSDMSSYMQSGTSEEASESWARSFERALEGHRPYGGAKYTVVSVSQLIGVMTCVLVRAEHYERVSKVMMGFFAVGKFGILGNKGAVAVRFRFQIGPRKFKTVCFVGSHLSAHQNEVAKRNSDFRAIFNGLCFVPIDWENSTEYISRSAVPLEDFVGARSRFESMPSQQQSNSPARLLIRRLTGASGSEPSGKGIVNPSFAGAVPSPPPPPSFEKRRKAEAEDDFRSQNDLLALSFGQNRREISIADHDLVFWCGDLNYRINSFSWKEAISLINQRSLGKLLSKDQLIRERESGRVFQGFNEGEINFIPTYKFQPGTNSYDTRKAEEKGLKKPRVPAWCDRVLWRAADVSNNQVQICSYFSAPQYLISDHKPIGAVFVMPFVEVPIGGAGMIRRPTFGVPKQLEGMVHRLSQSYAASQQMLRDRRISLGRRPSQKIMMTGRHSNGPPPIRSRHPRPGCQDPPCSTRQLPRAPPHRGDHGGPPELIEPPSQKLLRKTPRSMRRPSDSSLERRPQERRGNYHGNRSSRQPLGRNNLATRRATPAPPSMMRAPPFRNEAHIGRQPAWKKETSSFDAPVKRQEDVQPPSNRHVLQDSPWANQHRQKEQDYYEFRSFEKAEEDDVVRTAVALRDFEGGRPDELHFLEGDLIELMIEEKIPVNDGWLPGRRITDGSVGYFPATYVNALGAMTKTRRRSKMEIKALRKASAHRYHRKKEESHHSPVSTESIWSCVMNGLRSIFGASARGRLQEPRSMLYLKVKTYSEMRAKAPYIAIDADELSFQRGDVLKILSASPEAADNDEGWLMALLDGRQGLVPRNLLEPIL